MKIRASQCNWFPDTFIFVTVQKFLTSEFRLSSAVHRYVYVCKLTEWKLIVAQLFRIFFLPIMKRKIHYSIDSNSYPHNLFVYDLL
jgi:hypothetical protein